MSSEVLHSGAQCLFCEDPFGDGTRVCCDANGKCRRFYEKCRDFFWPFFSHPRWLCCDELYSCCDPCDRVVAEDHDHDHHDHDHHD